MSAPLASGLILFAMAAHAIAAEPVSEANLTEAQRQGRELFNASCAFCHGERGHATALLAKRVGQDNAMLERRSDLNAELIRHVVRRGINSMPWYRRAELSDDELELITSYLMRTSSGR